MRNDSASASSSDANGGQQPTARLVWYAWFPRDFRSSTLGWPLIAKAVYRDLLDAEFDMGGLPPEPAKLRALIAATPTQWRASWAPFVESKFPIGADGLRRNARLEQHRQKALQISATRAEAGRRGAAASAEQRRRASETAIRR